MRPVMWFLLYFVSVLAMVPVFVAILYAKQATTNPKMWADEASAERKQAKIKAWSEAIMYAIVWPVALVGLGVYFIFTGVDMGLPREIRKQLKRKKDRETIKQWEKEQYGETKDPE